MKVSQSQTSVPLLPPFVLFVTELDPLLVIQLCGETRHGFDRLAPEELAELQTSQAEQAKWAKLKDDIWCDVTARKN
eukprot:m.115609 g.115609  ORF g.115609 m.115609 type:complete len:77 (+) comp21579_c0_seq2:1835-2065(+)